MDRLFLDTNYFIDIAEQRNQASLDDFDNFSLTISPLSVHVLCYSYHVRMPDKKVENLVNEFILVPFDSALAFKALSGPTKDFEDNVQLHSAITADCDFFLTTDKQLLTMGYFGAMRICSHL
ncbi:hypothetical protein HY468_04545 [Candidatus Roizmanbacteria bacterium]|nr:hypothetical protein [Candidatus Roizmanbacteria bacterium]